MSEKVIIIGGGPAGLMTAIQLKRYGIRPRLFEKKQLGGLLWNANLVENYPGFPGGIPGPKLVSLFIEQFFSLDLAFSHENVNLIDYSGANFEITTDSRLYSSKILVIASGTKPKRLTPKLLPISAQSRVYYEIYPLLKEKNKTITIIGAGDAAFDYAINLASRNKIIILNRSDQIKALPLLVSRSHDIENIQYLPNQALNSLELNGNKLIIRTSCESGKEELKTDFLIVAIGREENHIPFTKQLQTSEISLVKNKHLHYIGDIHNGIFRQTAIAVGDGLKAAMQIYQFLKEN